MKPINAFTWNDYESRIDKMWKPVGVHKLAEGDCQSPVTILPGHLAESLRWRKVGEEEPEVGKRYVVQQGSIVTVAIYGRRSDGVGVWGYRGMPLVEDATPFDLYRPAIPGIDYVEGEV